jgi:hypothetical protein
VKVIGIRCSKDQFQWVALEGTTRSDAVVVERKELQLPDGDRAEQLAWVRKEVLELLTRHAPDEACLRVAEAGPNGAAALLQRAEVDGVVQATCGERGILVRRFFGATVRAQFAAKNKPSLDAALALIPCVADSAKLRREQVAVAVAAFPT